MLFSPFKSLQEEQKVLFFENIFEELQGFLSEERQTCCLETAHLLVLQNRKEKSMLAPLFCCSIFLFQSAELTSILY